MLVNMVGFVIGSVIGIVAAFLVICCCVLAGDADERIERMGVRENKEAP